MTQSDAFGCSKYFSELSRSRRSVRGFLPTPIADEKLREIFEVANMAPSNCNTQPWHAYVASGQLRDQLSDSLLKTIGQGEHDLDFPYDAKYPGIYRTRQVDVGLLLYKALGVTREDKEGKKQAFLRNLKFFGAPHVVFLFMPDWCDIREAIDVGMYAQNLMLSMQAHGVSSCPQTILGYNSAVVREAFGIDDSMKLLFGISFGYEESSLPENQIIPDRAELSENTHFHQ